MRYRPAIVCAMIAAATAQAPRDLVDEFAGIARAYEESQAFVSLLAHELRTRLKTIELTLRSADPCGDPGPALASTHATQELVESLLELARGRDDTSTDTDQALRGALEGLDLDGVAVVGAPDLPVVPLPHALLETVLRNLIANAIEAGASQIFVDARPDGTICVSDNGPGVPPATAERIFGVYTGKFGGAGLGLTLCREIMRRRGGDIWLELPSTFCFRVP
jgi:signal transduction histidine kinase